MLVDEGLLYFSPIVELDPRQEFRYDGLAGSRGVTAAVMIVIRQSCFQDCPADCLTSVATKCSPGSFYVQYRWILVLRNSQATMKAGTQSLLQFNIIVFYAALLHVEDASGYEHGGDDFNPPRSQRWLFLLFLGQIRSIVIGQCLDLFFGQGLADIAHA